MSVDQQALFTKSAKQTLRRPVIGLVLSDHKAFPALRAAVEQLGKCGIGVRGYVLGGAVDPDYTRWLTALKESGGAAVWVVVTESPATLHAASAAQPGLPIFCQVIGGKAQERQQELISNLSGAALFPANRPLEAAKILTQVCALFDHAVAARMAHLAADLKESERQSSVELQQEIDKLTGAGMPASSPRPAAPSAAAAPLRDEITAEDSELLREVEAQMRPKVLRKGERATPPAKHKTLDYSIPLRKVVNTAREIAAGYLHSAVQAEHLLAAIIDLPETAAHQALLNAGVDLETIASQMIANFPPAAEDFTPGVYELDESANQVLSSARQAARTRERTCLTTLDFLEGLALYASAADASLSWAGSIPTQGILQAIVAFASDAECGSTEKAQPSHSLTTSDLVHGEPISTLGERLAPQERSTAAPPVIADPKEEKGSEQSLSLEVPPRPRVYVTSAGMPGVNDVEAVSDILLEGRLVALPMDTMFGLVADATNAGAVGRLRSAAGVDPNRPLGVLIHSMAQLRHVARGITTEASMMLEELWPGPLTVIFKKHPSGFLHLNRSATLALRIPGDFLSLSVLSSVGRPLAVTSIDALEPGGVMGAKQVTDRMAGKIDAVIDTREAPDPVVTTVLSLVEEKPKILRQGAVSAETLKAHLPDLEM